MKTESLFDTVFKYHNSRAYGHKSTCTHEWLTVIYNVLTILSNLWKYQQSYKLNQNYTIIIIAPNTNI